jgi:hypothetical protein
MGSALSECKADKHNQVIKEWKEAYYLLHIKKVFQLRYKSVFCPKKENSGF